MNSREEFINDVIHEKINISIEIVDSQNNFIGRLVPLTISLLGNVEIMTKMAEWRNKVGPYFLTQFHATVESRRDWLKDVVLKDNSRLLFLIYSPTKLIGQYGFKGLSSDMAEIDNLIRGEMGGHPRLIYFTEIALIKWLFQTFQLKKIYGFVVADNFMALDLHQSVGFRLTELIPLYKKELPGKIDFEMGKPGDPSPDGRYYQKVELVPNDFISEGR
jgi:hypothetical protein